VFAKSEHKTETSFTILESSDDSKKTETSLETPPDLKEVNPLRKQSGLLSDRLAVVKTEGMLHSISNLQQTFQQENVTSTIQQNPENKHVPDQFVPGSYHGVYSNGQVNSCSLETEDIVVGKRHQLPTSSNGSDRKEYIKGRRRKQGSSTMLRSKVDFDGIKRMYSSNSAAGQEFRQDYVPIFNALDQRGYGQMIRFCSRFGIPFLGRGPLRSIRWAFH